MANTTTTYDVKQIVNMLPHRFPFLLVDRVLDVDLEKWTIHAIKNLTYNEQFFQGHFPGAPIMPGVLIIEALAQAAGVLVHLVGGEDNAKIALLMNIKEAKFRNPAKPGDVLHLKCEGMHFSSRGGKVKATAYVDDKVAVQAEMGFALVDKTQI
ncbi:MAG: 3-hydroxyacyl-ACP dehydratase FabZ [Chlamydiales bacterium]|nr:3-hydroxyacyl-ACP dehydratase FabZ [Chlamydiia bacterium]MCP5506910.1 3-hydroxyacyl-ACP dehydratase FabZ [Chlamydiales bacterium]